MPYIGSKTRREELDQIVDLMTKLEIRADGDLNYVLFKYCFKEVPKYYGVLKGYRAELRECADEIGRRLLGPLEELKMIENGDVND